MGQSPDAIASSEFRMPSLGADMEAGTVVACILATR